MVPQVYLRKLIDNAQKGDDEALTQIIVRFTPAIKKHSHQLGYDEAYSDLVLWMITAVKHYRPRNSNRRYGT